MTVSFFLTQVRVDSEIDVEKVRKQNTIRISEPEFTELLRKHWPATNDPVMLSANNWLYRPRKSDNEREFGELSLLGNDTVSARHLPPTRWVLFAIIFQRYLKRPIYMWNSSDVNTYLEITDTTTEKDVLLFLDSG